ncbi:hypothetical protein VIGAN_10089800 [Vigna angularis var. angularis]|uniref:Uncharacterized protein n=1 Tax=Vigna angularis var. angularis TaxID=157739 RepID=A0A0S3T2J7_PHAAN|nr:hypothetical protein VIGAN_10089800 [Vigna angularis var. angularis]
MFSSSSFWNKASGSSFSLDVFKLFSIFKHSLFETGMQSFLLPISFVYTRISCSWFSIFPFSSSNGTSNLLFSSFHFLNFSTQSAPSSSFAALRCLVTSLLFKLSVKSSFIC